ncbi:MAG: methylated-DNA--[protein]-cysteine S-methyltransferase [Chloroflexota bacterium]|nr:methylated-DNA--[protein]-cysteine S-methyltransferase [Chloroflexota bacterium]
MLVSDGLSLTGLYMDASRHGPQGMEQWLRNDNAVPFAEAKQQLAAYFAGTLRDFDLAIAPQGSAFQQQVWRELLKIPYGVTTSYGRLAGSLGNSNASRAVGLANGRNPISIIVPCHRVIGANGRLVGYGGGLNRKEALLAFESQVLTTGPQPFCPVARPLQATF